MILVMRQWICYNKKNKKPSIIDKKEDFSNYA